MKAWKTNCLLVLVGLLFGLAVAEVGLRIAGVTYPLFYRYDPYVGSGLRPGARGYWTKEGGGWVSINSDGLRDVEHTVEKPANTLRIAVLGDSFAEAFQVNGDETFWAVMGRVLQGCKKLGGRKVEVINLGQSGFGATQELLVLRRRGWKYSPDVVLLAFFIGNDIADNSRVLKKKDYHPYYVFEGDKLVLDDRKAKETYAKYESPLNDFRIRLRNSSRVLQVLKKGTDAITSGISRKRDGGVAKAAAPVSEPGIDDSTYHEPTTRVWKEAWRVTEGVLLMIRNEVRSRGAELFVVILGSGFQVNPDSAYRRRIQQSLGVKDLSYPVRRVEKFCSREAIPVLSIVQPFLEYSIVNKMFLHGFEPTLGSGHWNEDGHRLAGRMIAKWLCEQPRFGDSSGRVSRGAPFCKWIMPFPQECSATMGLIDGGSF